MSFWHSVFIFLSMKSSIDDVFKWKNATLKFIETVCVFHWLTCRLKMVRWLIARWLNQIFTGFHSMTASIFQQSNEITHIQIEMWALVRWKFLNWRFLFFFTFSFVCIKCLYIRHRFGMSPFKSMNNDYGAYKQKNESIIKRKCYNKRVASDKHIRE